jgi:tight adherence protein B
VRRLARIAAASAAVAALVLPGLALGQTGGAKLTEAQDSAFPDRVYIYRTPERTALKRLEVSENGGPVTGLAVSSNTKSSGAILLIDASNSMKGAPIAGAMVAARAFLAQRKADLPVAVIAYNPEVTVLTDFTTDPAKLASAVATAPETTEGTHIYDALIEAAELAEGLGLPRMTAVLLSDGHRRGVQASRAEALEALNAANVRVISVGLRSPEYDAETLQSVARRTGGTYVVSENPKALEGIFSEIGAQLSNEYVVTYRSLLPPSIAAVVTATAPPYAPASAKYTTPPLALTTDRGTFERSWIDKVIVSPYLAVFIVVSVIALLALALLTWADARNRSLRHRMAQYVTVPTEEDSRMRRAEVTAMLADRAQRRVESHRWWQSFERDVELGGFKYTPVGLAGWTVIGAIVTSLVVTIAFQSLWGLLVGLFVPLVTRFVVKSRVNKKRKAFREQLPDNLDVLAGALRAGHSLVGAMNVMLEGAAEPFKSEFRRVLQDEQLGVPLDDALMVMSGRMNSADVEQVAIVTRLQREAGGNTAEVLDRVVDNIRGRMELQRLVQVLTAQGKIARYILTAIPVFLLAFFFLVNPVWLEPLWQTTVGNIAMVMWVIMLVAGWFAIKKIVEIEV